MTATPRNPLRLITIGVGIENYNDTLLEQLAQHGNGWYRYLSNDVEARALFSRDSWLPLSVPFADQTRAQVRWNDAVVESWRLVGYENRVTSDESFTQDRKEFAEIPHGRRHHRLLRGAAAAHRADQPHGAPAPRRGPPALGHFRSRGAPTSSRRRFRQPPSQMNDAQDAALLDFGALVALAADRYASLPRFDARDAGFVQRELQTIYERLLPLGGQLGEPGLLPGLRLPAGAPQRRVAQPTRRPVRATADRSVNGAWAQLTAIAGQYSHRRYSHPANR